MMTTREMKHKVRKSNDREFPGVVNFMGIEGFFFNGKFRPIFRGGDGTDDSASKKDSEGGTGDADDKSKDKSKNQGGTDTEDKEDKSGEKKTFTQEQLNDIIAREKTSALRGKLDPKELGFTSQKELKEFVDSMKAKADEEKTDAEKATQEAVEKAVKEAEEGILKEANRRVLKAEFTLKATKAKIHPDRVDDAFTLAQQNEDLWKGVDVDEKGVVTGLNETFFDDLKKAKSFLFEDEKSEEGEGSNDAGARSGGGSGATGDAKDKDLREKFPALNRILGN